MNFGVITGVSVAHDRATVDDIEAACRHDQDQLVASLVERPGVSEAFVLQTCHRAEAYVVTGAPADGHAALADVVADVEESSVVWRSHEESLRHLLRVAAGLESLVLGEDQILGQVRDAFEDAKAAGGVGPMFEDAILKAIHVGERARTETAINEGIVSIGSAAVELAAEAHPLGDATALVVGAGEMGRLAATALVDAGVARLLLANRSVEGAAAVRDSLDVDRDGSGDVTVEPVPLDSLPVALDAAEVVVTATGSPDHLVGQADLADAGETIVIDIARPRDVDPAAAELAGVTVFDLDDLDAVTERTRRERRNAARAVETMVDREFDRLLEQFKRKRADEAIGAMYENAAATKRRALERAIDRLEADGELTDAQRETVEALADSLINKLLAAPTKSLREAAAEDDWTTINTALQLFDPEFDGEGLPSWAGRDPDPALEDGDEGARPPGGTMRPPTDDG